MNVWHVIETVGAGVMILPLFGAIIAKELFSTGPPSGVFLITTCAIGFYILILGHVVNIATEKRVS
jgi:hypothetical protein